MEKTYQKRKPLMIYWAIALIMIIMVIFMYWWKIKSNVEEKREVKRLDGILEEINNLYVENDDLKNQWQELEDEQERIHWSAEENREEIRRLWNEYYKDKVDGKVMDKICELSSSSPMCGDYEMLMKLMEISEKRWVDYKLLLGIMYAESHIGANFNIHNCGSTNNWAGLKARKYDDGSMSEWFDKQYEKLNDESLNGCRLYKFDSVYDFFESLANTISIGYKKCNEDPYCIMKSYVGHESGAWVRNVYLFKSL